MVMKSDKLKKMEQELADLEQWLKLGMVPQKDEAKHEEEIKALKAKINEEIDRLKFLKETGEIEEYVTPKRTTGKAAFSESTSMTDIEMQPAHEEMDMDIEEEQQFDDDSDYDSEDEEESDDAFSDNGRFKRGWGGDILDPDSDEW
ncbi:MAG: hypothetical protein ACQEP8_01040 [Chlamydiota bacterium]